MAVMMARLYDALKSAGVPEDKASAAAEEAASDKTLLSSIDQRLAAIESKFLVLIWAVGINAAATVAMLVRGLK